MCTVISKSFGEGPMKKLLVFIGLLTFGQGFVFAQDLLVCKIKILGNKVNCPSGEVCELKILEESGSNFEVYLNDGDFYAEKLNLREIIVDKGTPAEHGNKIFGFEKDNMPEEINRNLKANLTFSTIPGIEYQILKERGFVQLIFKSDRDIREMFLFESTGEDIQQNYLLTNKVSLYISCGIFSKSNNQDRKNLRQVIEKNNANENKKQNNDVSRE